MLNMASVDPAHEEEFNCRYHAEHIPDVMQRFLANNTVRDPDDLLQERGGNEHK